MDNDWHSQASLVEDDYAVMEIPDIHDPLDREGTCIASFNAEAAD